MLKSKRFNTAATIILTVLVIITLLPLALIVISSFTKESALIRKGRINVFGSVGPDPRP